MNTASAKSGRGWVLAQSLLLLALVASGPLGRAATDDAWLSGTATVIGGVLFAIGTFFGVAGVRHLGRNRTPYPEPLADAELVTAGVYAVVRHPLYASLIYAGFGWALIWSSHAALLIATIALGFFTAKARTEERHLRDRFPAYTDYARRVKRLLPGVW
jgi:protein-S-isoprenylcysteine O-methyltransferase Ste14